MIPQHPNWSILTDIKPYPQPAFQRPPALDVSVQAVSIGPALLNNSGGKLTSRYWVVFQEEGQVRIAGADSTLEIVTLISSDGLTLTDINGVILQGFLL